MNRLKLVLAICAIYIVTVFSGTWLSMYLDSKFYGDRAYANDVENYDDSEWHFNYWIQRRSELDYQVLFVFPDIDKKTTRLVRYHDSELDMYCYILENRPYNFKTGLNCWPGWMIRNGGMK